MKRCDWCNKNNGNLIKKRLVTTGQFGIAKEERIFHFHPGCESFLKEFLSYQKRYSKRFVLCMIGTLLAIIISLIIGVTFSEPIGIILIGLDISFLGISIFLLPFATPQTVQLLGYQKSRLLGKGTGLLLVLTGIIFILFIL